MSFPYPFESGLTVLLYLFMLYIIGLGIWQFVHVRILRRVTVKYRSLVPLGAAALAVSFIGYFQNYKSAFDEIELAGDISPSIVANAVGNGFSYPILGLFCLAVSFLFRYTNQRQG